MIVVGKQLRPSEMSIIPVQRLVALHSKNQEIWFVSKKMQDHSAAVAKYKETLRTICQHCEPVSVQRHFGKILRRLCPLQLRQRRP